MPASAARAAEALITAGLTELVAQARLAHHVHAGRIAAVGAPVEAPAVPEPAPDPVPPCAASHVVRPIVRVRLDTVPTLATKPFHRVRL
jgi:hypothetical protein